MLFIFEFIFDKTSCLQKSYSSSKFIEIVIKSMTCNLCLICCIYKNNLSSNSSNIEEVFAESVHSSGLTLVL